MSPFAALITTATLLLLAGSLLLWNGPGVSTMARRFPRSQRAAWVSTALAAGWTLYYVTRLGESDFGNYKRVIFVAFALLAILALRYATDFLAVRSSSGLTLLVAWVLLNATYGHYEFLVLVYKAFLYLAVLLALYLAVSPFRLRDFFQWLFARAHRARVLGAALGLFGTIFISAAFSHTL